MRSPNHGAAVPRNGEGLTVGAVQAPKEAEQNASIVASTPDCDKIVSSFKARFALLGHAVHDLADGGFIVSRWNLTRHCPDVRALGAFLKQIGGGAL